MNKIHCRMGCISVTKFRMVDSGLMASTLLRKRCRRRESYIEKNPEDEDGNDDIAEMERTEIERFSIGNDRRRETNFRPSDLGPFSATFSLTYMISLGPTTRLEKCHRQAGLLKTNCSAILDSKVMPNDSTNNPPVWVLHKSATSAKITIDAIAKLYQTKLAEWGFDPINDAAVYDRNAQGGNGNETFE